MDGAMLLPHSGQHQQQQYGGYGPRAPPQLVQFPSMVRLGMHCQWPYTRTLMDGSKTVETRDYPLPPEYVGQEVRLPNPNPRRPTPTLSHLPHQPALLPSVHLNARKGSEGPPEDVSNPNTIHVNRAALT